MYICIQQTVVMWTRIPILAYVLNEHATDTTHTTRHNTVIHDFKFPFFDFFFVFLQLL